MRISTIIIGLVMMSGILLTKFIPALYFLLPCSIPLFLGGMIAFIVGLTQSKFTNIKKEEKEN